MGGPHATRSTEQGELIDIQRCFMASAADCNHAIKSVKHYMFNHAKFVLHFHRMMCSCRGVWGQE